LENSSRISSRICVKRRRQERALTLSLGFWDGSDEKAVVGLRDSNVKLALAADFESVVHFDTFPRCGQFNKAANMLKSAD
jgi:hypothetical protein